MKSCVLRDLSGVNVDTKEDLTVLLYCRGRWTGIVHELINRFVGNYGQVLSMIVFCTGIANKFPMKFVHKGCSLMSGAPSDNPIEDNKEITPYQSCKKANCGLTPTLGFLTSR